ncbi:MAG: hypothetical protein LUE93_12275 [Bacteroides sp.]|nr:hypothetical protein [Bacteroides sp.]
MKYPGYLLFLVFLLFSVTLRIHATIQVTETILIDGTEKKLLTVPLDQDPVLKSAIAALTESREISTGCYRGYRGKWQMQNDQLYLVELTTIEGEVLPIPEVFLPYKEGDRYLASWFTGELRVGEGEVIYYSPQNIGFSYYFAKETFYKLAGGKIMQQKEYENTFVPARNSFEASLKEIAGSFGYEKFPELTEGDRIVLAFQLVPTPEGKFSHFSYCRLLINQGGERMTLTDPDHPYLKEVLSLFRQIPQWDVLFLYGEIQPLPWYALPFTPISQLTNR